VTGEKKKKKKKKKKNCRKRREKQKSGSKWFPEYHIREKPNFYQKAGGFISKIHRQGGGKLPKVLGAQDSESSRRLPWGRKREKD